MSGDGGVGTAEFLRLLMDAQKESNETGKEVARALLASATAQIALKETLDKVGTDLAAGIRGNLDRVEKMSDAQEARMTKLASDTSAAVESRYKWLIIALIGIITFLIVAFAALVGIKLQSPGITGGVESSPRTEVAAESPESPPAEIAASPD